MLVKELSRSDLKNMMTNEQVDRWASGRIISSIIGVCAIVVMFSMFLRISRQDTRLDESESRMFSVAVSAIEEHDTKAIVRLDSNGNIAYMNDVAVGLFDLQIGETIETIIPEEYREQHRTQLQKAMGSEKAAITSIHCEVVAKDGRRKVVARTWTTQTGAIAILTLLD